MSSHKQCRQSKQYDKWKTWSAWQDHVEVNIVHIFHIWLQNVFHSHCDRVAGLLCSSMNDLAEHDILSKKGNLRATANCLLSSQIGRRSLHNSLHTLLYQSFWWLKRLWGDIAEGKGRKRGAPLKPPWLSLLCTCAGWGLVDSGPMGLHLKGSKKNSKCLAFSKVIHCFFEFGPRVLILHYSNFVAIVHTQVQMWDKFCGHNIQFQIETKFVAKV